MPDTKPLSLSTVGQELRDRNKKLSSSTIDFSEQLLIMKDTRANLRVETISSMVYQTLGKPGSLPKMSKKRLTELVGSNVVLFPFCAAEHWMFAIGFPKERELCLVNSSLPVVA